MCQTWTQIRFVETEWSRYNDRSKQEGMSTLRLPLFEQENRSQISRSRSHNPRTIGLIVLNAILLGVVVFVAGQMIRTRHVQDRGVVWGIPPHIPLAAVPPWGVNVELTRYPDDQALDNALRAVSHAGLYWVRQSFRWAEIEPERGVYRWAQADRWVQAVRRHHLKLIAVLDSTPPWARAPNDADEPQSPPLHYEDFGQFAAAFAHRYGTSIFAYQIWNEPNIAPHWGHRYVDPVAYTFLLRTAARAIRAVNPQSVIVMAALAPTTEPGGTNMNEVLYLRGMYGAGAAPFFDVLAAEPYGFRTGPEDRRVSPKVLNFSRVLLLRKEMVDWGDSNKAIWATAFGWNALPPGWTGHASIWGSTTPQEQAAYTWQAVTRAQAEWPWMGAMLLPALQPDVAANDPRWGFALLSPNGDSTPLYEQLVQAVGKPKFAGPGWYAADVPVSGVPWAFHSPALSFRGTQLDLVLRGPIRGQATIDGRDVPHEIVVTALGRQRVTLLHGLSDGPHKATFTVTEAGAQARFESVIVARERTDWRYRLEIFSLLLAALFFGGQLMRQLGKLHAPHYWQTAVRWLLQRGAFTGFLLAATSTLAIFYMATSWPLILAGLLLTAFLYLLRPDVGLTLTVFCIPFFLLPKNLPGGKHFSLVEVLTLVGATIWVVRQILPPTWWEAAQTTEKKRDRVRWNWMDGAVLSFLVLSLLSVVWATNFGTAARQFRVVVLEPVIFYGLVRVYAQRRENVLRMLDALVLAGLVLALYALWQAVTGIGVITAQGVFRVRSVYGSPNNLALFLGRVLPITIAVLMFAPTSRRRWAYGLAAIPLTAAVFLTFSRGAWLLGLPAAVLFLAWYGNRRVRMAFAFAALAGLIAVLPFATTERLTSLLHIREGTSVLRLDLWASTLQMIRDHPWRGIGLDNFLYLYPRYIQPAAWGEPALSHPHNVLLHFWVALGIFGLIIFLWQQTIFWHSTIDRLHHGMSGWERAILLGLAASMLDFLAHGMIDNSYFLVDLAFVYMLTVGAIASLLVVRLPISSRGDGLADDASQYNHGQQIGDHR